jgi:hypothetical protein
VGQVELEAAAALYSGALLEELQPFALVDRLVELWLHGGLPTGPATSAAHALDHYWRDGAERLSDEARAGLYAAVFAAPFHDLWVALLAALARAEPDAGERADAVRAQLGAAVGEATLRAAPLLVTQLRAALEVLHDREILAAYGARDSWTLIDTLARLELGREVDVARVRTMAATGSVVIVWLASAPAGAPAAGEAVEAAQAWLTAATRAGPDREP